jgi:hypothetical protein
MADEAEVYESVENEIRNKERTNKRANERTSERTSECDVEKEDPYPRGKTVYSKAEKGV